MEGNASDKQWTAGSATELVRQSRKVFKLPPERIAESRTLFDRAVQAGGFLPRVTCIKGQKAPAKDHYGKASFPYDVSAQSFFQGARCHIYPETRIPIEMFWIASRGRFNEGVKLPTISVFRRMLKQDPTLSQKLAQQQNPVVVRGAPEPAPQQTQLGPRFERTLYVDESTPYLDLYWQSYLTIADSFFDSIIPYALGEMVHSGIVDYRGFTGQCDEFGTAVTKCHHQEDGRIVVTARRHFTSTMDLAMAEGVIDIVSLYPSAIVIVPSVLTATLRLKLAFPPVGEPAPRAGDVETVSDPAEAVQGTTPDPSNQGH